MTNIVSIDIGIKNIGICNINSESAILYLCNKNDITKILNTIITKKTIVLIERQRFSNLMYIQGYITGYLENNVSQIHTVCPFSFKKGFKTYKQRKDYSIKAFRDNLRESNIIDKTNEIKKIDDMCDAYNIAVRYIKKNINGGFKLKNISYNILNED